MKQLDENRRINEILWKHTQEVKEQNKKQHTERGSTAMPPAEIKIEERAEIGGVNKIEA